MESKGKTYSDRHLVKMRGNLQNYILPEFGNLVLSAIRQRDIDDYLIDLKSIRDNKTKLFPANLDELVANWEHLSGPHTS